MSATKTVTLRDFTSGSKEVKLKYPKNSNARRHITALFPEVKHIKDATEPLEVEVSAYDRVSGKVKNPQDCAMARACRRKYGLDGAIISVSTAYLVKGDTALRYSVPPSLAREVVTFDRNKNFSAGLYRLGCFADTNKLGVSHAKDQTPSKSTRRKTKFHMTDNIRNFYDRAIHKGEEE